MPTDDEMSLLSLCICVPRAISLTLGHHNILSTVGLFVCTSLMGMAVFVLGVFVFVLAPYSPCTTVHPTFMYNALFLIEHIYRRFVLTQLCQQEGRILFLRC